MRVVSIDPLSDPLWRMLADLPGAGLFHSPSWMAALRDAYGFELRAYVAVDDADEPQGGIAFCVIEDQLGARIASLPFSDACDPLLPGSGAWPLLKERLAEHRLPIAFRCLEAGPLAADPALVVVKRARWHTLAITDPADVLRARFSSATRRAVAKGERSGVTVRPLDDDGLAAFHALHVRLRKRKYRLLAQPFAFFAAIADRFRAADAWHPLGVFEGNRLLAATIYLRFGNTLYYKFNASDDAGLPFRPNNLLVAAGIRIAQELGLQVLDLGPSDDDQPGLIRFKRGFGAAERELRFLKWTPAGAPSDRVAELKGVLGEVTRLFTLPAVADEATAAAGAALYRLFA